MSYIKGNRPNLYEEEEVTDEEFLRSGRNNFSSNSKDATLEQIHAESKRLQQSTLQSTRTTLGLIYETEKVGLGTAEELLHQREQLENVDQKLDGINSIMRVSQKHITSMKSVFGGIKNYFSKDKNAALPNKPGGGESSKMKSSASENVLSKTLNTLKNDVDDVHQSSHPRMKNLESISESPSSNNISAFDKQLDDNLLEIGAGVGRLKELALGLGSEIDSQNKLLDRIGSKADRSQDTIANQNRQMKRILKS